MLTDTGPGQIVRLGRIKYKVIEVNKVAMACPNYKSCFFDNTKKIVVDDSLVDENSECRYCMQKESDAEG